MKLPSGARIFLVVWHQWEKGWCARIDVNPSRILDPFGVSLCPPRDAPPVLQLVWEAVMDYLTPAVPLGEAHVSRIDVTADFGLDVADQTDGPVRLIGDLYDTWRPCSRDRRLFRSRVTGTITGFWDGSKSGGHVEGYSKDLESGGLAEAGTFRLEVQARDWAARYGGIVTVGDINPDNVGRLFVDRFAWSGAGRWLANPVDEEGCACVRPPVSAQARLRGGLRRLEITPWMPSRAEAATLPATPDTSHAPWPGPWRTPDSMGCSAGIPSGARRGQRSAPRVPEPAPRVVLAPARAYPGLRRHVLRTRAGLRAQGRAPPGTRGIG